MKTKLALALALCFAQTLPSSAAEAANPKHSEYHYTDVPFQLDQYHDHGVGTDEHDIVQSLRQAIWVLQGKDGAAVNPHKFTKRQALLLLAHLAGDVHQPLHVGSAFISKDGVFVVPLKQEQIDGVNIFNPQGGNNMLLDDARMIHESTPIQPLKEGGYRDTLVVTCRRGNFQGADVVGLAPSGV
eukprot:gene27409-30980_t